MCPNTTGFCRVSKFKYFQKSEFKVKHHTNMLKISQSQEQRMARPAKDHTTPAGFQAKKASKTARQRSYGLSIIWTWLQYILFGVVSGIDRAVFGVVRGKSRWLRQWKGFVSRIGCPWCSSSVDLSVKTLQVCKHHHFVFLLSFPELVRNEVPIQTAAHGCCLDL